MASSNFAVVFDACVLYPAHLRDFLMHLATSSHLFRAKWSHEIHDEWIRNLLANRPELTREKLENTKRKMIAAVPDSLVDPSLYEALIPTILLPDPNDAHVLAAAVASRADLLLLTSAISPNRLWRSMMSGRYIPMILF